MIQALTAQKSAGVSRAAFTKNSALILYRFAADASRAATRSEICFKFTARCDFAALYYFTAHYGERQARLNFPRLNTDGRILPEICRRSLALCNERRNFVLNFKRHIKNTIILYNPAHRSIGHAHSSPNRANNEIKNKGEAMSKAVLHSVLAIEAILWGLLSAVIIGA